MPRNWVTTSSVSWKNMLKSTIYEMNNVSSGCNAAKRAPLIYCNVSVWKQKFIASTVDLADILLIYVVFLGQVFK